MVSFEESRKSIVVVGSGIVGLCVAEYFSAKANDYSVKVISDFNPSAGSLAAAANLAIKGQQMARDPNFGVKLKSRSLYSGWLSSLLKEMKEIKDQKNNTDNIGKDLKSNRLSALSLADIFHEGNGIDYFKDSNERDFHLKRVLESKEMLEKKNFHWTSSLPLAATK